MRTFFVACIAAIIIAIGAAVVLDRYYQKPTEQAYKSTSVRI
jgi:hypothetical protein